MTSTIFYSWQSDLPNPVNRTFLENALKGAIKEINSTDQGRQCILDSDTRGMPGAPHIVETILRKIDKASVFVADVTPVVTSSEDAIPNANVMLETGYALAKLGPSRVITIVNEAYGAVSRLPFDLSYRRALTYTLPEVQENRATTLNEVVRTRVRAIQQALPPVVPEVGPSEQELPDPTNRSEQIRWNFPRAQLGSAEQAWVEILAEAFDTGERPEQHVLLRKHRARLGLDFSPATVDARLVTEEGRDITPLGLWHVNHDTPWLARVDQVFRYIKQLLESNPALNELSVATLGRKLGLATHQVSHCIHLLRTCHGWCCAGTAQNHDPQHHLPLISVVRLGKDPVLRFYERFASLDEVIRGTLLAPIRPREF